MWLWMVGAMATAMGEDLLKTDVSWQVVNDTVMGGVSNSRMTDTKKGVRFEGSVSLDNNGGFASVRSVPTDLSWDGVRAVRLTVKGDGKRYDVTLHRSDLQFRGGSYRTSIATTGEVQVIELPIEDFVPTAFGRPLPAAPPLPGADIAQVGLLIGDKQVGSFAIEVRQIEPVLREAPEPASTDARRRIARTLSAAIARGVPAFNEGEPGRCADIYATGVTAALGLAPDALSGPELRTLQAALTQSLREDATAAAWTLRRAMDAVMTAIVEPS